MTTRGDALDARWRRLGVRVQEVRAGVGRPGISDRTLSLAPWTRCMTCGSSGRLEPSSRVKGPMTGCAASRWGNRPRRSFMHAQGSRTIPWSSVTTPTRIPIPTPPITCAGVGKPIRTRNPASRSATLGTPRISPTRRVLPVLETALTWLRQQLELRVREGRELSLVVRERV